ILIDWFERWRKGEAEWDDVYVWWTAIRSSNRIKPLPHLDEVLAIDQQTADKIETHLYLTDYRSLYVAQLGEITKDNPLEHEDEGSHMPTYEHDKPAHFFFRLDDIRRLVADDTVATVQELAKLSNVRYDRRPVSIYGGMTDLPLIVERPDGQQWFGDRELIGQRLWAEHDVAMRSETDRMSRELRENLLGDKIWSALEHGTRAFLATGEATFRARRQDPSYDFSTVTVEYAKAVEAEMNGLIFTALRKHYGKGKPVGRQTTIDGRPVDLGSAVPHQTLGAIINVLEHNEDVKRGIRASFSQSDAQFLLGEAVHHLTPIAQLRNPAAHSAQLTQAEAAAIREQVLGIGQEGLICRIARLKM
ncbi:MAG TPA: hypothetical protein VFO52_00680, partial [Longimicrobiales bacterium]|nr:hypothetical protein [Longimicrobiales bacterium]